MEEIHQYLVDVIWSFTDFFFNPLVQIKLAEGSEFKSPGEFEITISLSQVCNSDQAEDSDFENAIASVFSDKKVHSQGGHTLFDLNIKPDQVLSIEEHQ